MQMLSRPSVSASEEYTLRPIGIIRTPFVEKFGVPRQLRLATHVKGHIEFFSPYDDAEAFSGLEGFSHLHVLFRFNLIAYENFKPRVRPPRLGGNATAGVFATRSPFRPNLLGLSIVTLDKIVTVHGRTHLEVSGVDLVDKTPILDIKPYIAFNDAIPLAQSGFASAKPHKVQVIFENDLEQRLRREGEERFYAVLECLSQDPRPAYKDENDKKMYTLKIFNYQLVFKFHLNSIVVVDIRIV